MDQPIDSLTRATSDTKGRRFGVLTISSKDIFEECPPLRTPLQKGLSQQIPARIPNACQFSSPDPWFPKSARISASPCALLIALNLICSDWGCCGKWDVKQSLVERLAQVWVLQRVASFDTEILRCQKHGRGRGRGRGPDVEGEDPWVMPGIDVWVGKGKKPLTLPNNSYVYGVESKTDTSTHSPQTVIASCGIRTHRTPSLNTLSIQLTRESRSKEK
ncbi:uncharacterized protein PADG_11976 [Paracoccidioides brasiliensis Pb18]|uniref:Uncharacterized protein n=1 Tax=Paracoccidioides brasiliensis (strain Pb18) TaxID=502780 RepID=A0A0A0HRL7_PARBD|nr:uncharacterized protein PADG_11976 [Paracoccidioides brasiliensis Pb18]KGM91839.1 hypothetical protein PADG_11976 [Paracoccidioides brasiliensis Pb18]